MKRKMEGVSLEVRVISCRHLKAFNFFQKLSVYVVGSIVVSEFKKDQQPQHCAQRQKTPIDKGGGSHSEWNHVMVFDLQSLSLPDRGAHLFLKFDLRCEGIIDRSIGEVRVPVKDLVEEYDAVVRFVSYKIRCGDSKANGVLELSYKIDGVINKKKMSKCGGGSCRSMVITAESSSLSPTGTGTNFPVDKVRYPSLDFDADKYQPSSRDICCDPSKAAAGDDIIYDSPSNSKAASSRLHYPTPTHESYPFIPLHPKPPPSPITVPNGMGVAYYHPYPYPYPCPLPMVQFPIQSQAYWYASDLEYNGYGYCRSWGIKEG